MRFGGLIIAIVLAAVAAVIVLRTSSTPAPQPVQQQAAPEVVKGVDIYVAAKEIPVGTTITQDMLAVQPWPEHLVLDGFIRAEGENTVVGTVARGTFQAQEPIIKTKLANANDSNFLAGELPKGMRVITIATNETDGVAGFVFPGDRVDVLLTHDVDKTTTHVDASSGQPKENTKADPVTETLLTNVKVLAVDQRSTNAGATDKDGKLLIPRSISLMVSPTDAQRVRLGAKAGTLTLALRGLADHESVDPLTITRGTDISQYQGDDAEDGVRVLRGAPGTVQEINNDYVNAMRAAPTTQQQVAVPAVPHPSK